MLCADPDCSAPRGWSRKEIGGLPVYAADEISLLPGIVQAFTTRHGGVGEPPYDTLNLGLNCGDDPRTVAANRALVAEALGFPVERFTFAEQVHGRGVAVIRNIPAPGEALPRADALVSDVPGVVLTLQFADCFPVYIVDPVKRVVALLHSGWRGTASNIVQAATDALESVYGVDPRSCLAAIGPGIAAENYEVGEDVASEFRQWTAHGDQIAVARADSPGKWNLNVRGAIYAQLRAGGYAAASIAVCGEDTFSNAADFFSHRRESKVELKTGRMAGVIGFLEE